MNKAIIAFLTLAVFASACNGGGKQTSGIKGKLSNSKGETIYLEELTSTTVVPRDSVKLDAEGNFAFAYTPSAMAFYRVKTAPGNFLMLIADSSEQIEISGDVRNLAMSYKVKGSVNSEKLAEANTVITKNFLRLDSLRNLFQMAQSKPGVNMDSLDKVLGTAYDNIVLEETTYLKEFIKQNSNSLASLAVIEKLSPETNYEDFKQLDQALNQTYPQNDYVKAFHARVEDLGKLANGSLAPEIQLSDPSGKIVTLSALRGKIVMIDFWASWCKPCRMENPNVVKLYNKYKGKGFEILGVSLDKDKEAWVQAISTDKLTWLHGSDLLFWSSPVAKEYNVQSIPMTYLIDQDGKIIAKGLRGAQLEEKLASLLK